MDKKFKKLWSKALRSGDFKQGTGCLKKGKKYCCLGVLCSVLMKAGYIKPMSWKGSDETLPEEIRKLVKIRHVTQDNLIAMNDGCDRFFGNAVERKSFSQIADYIEKKL